MNNSFYKLLSGPLKLYLFIVLLTGFISACNQKENDQNTNVSFSLSRADKLSSTSPRQAKALLDSIKGNVELIQLPDSLVTRYIRLQVGVMNNLGYKDSVYSFLSGIRENFAQIRQSRVRIVAGLWLAQLYTDDAKYFQAEKYLNEAFEWIPEDSLQKYKARAYNIKGTIKTFQGDYLDAQKQYLSAIRIFEQLDDPAMLGPVYINVAINYMAMGEKARALQYYYKACEISVKHNDSLNYIIALNNLGIYYLNSNLDSARYCFLKARDFMTLDTWSTEYLSTRFNLANLYVQQHKYTLALDMYREVLEISEKYKIIPGIYRAMAGMGDVYESMGNTSEALDLLHKSAIIAGETGETPSQISILESIIKIREKSGDWKNAALMLKQVKKMSDSLLSLEKQIAVRDLELLYNNEKTEKENELLNANITIMKNQARNNRIILGILLVSAIILGILLRYTYNLYKQRDSAYNALFEQYRKDSQAFTELMEVPLSSPSDKIAAPDIHPLFKKLVFYFDQEKPYLNPELKVDDVAASLNIPSRTLAKLIQDYKKVRFTTFVNEYRIKTALEMLADPKYKNFKIEAIAREAGFGSKVSFYSAFTQVTGLKPGDYRNLV